MRPNDRGDGPIAPTSSSRLLVRALHAWFRISRGLTLGVRAVVLDPEGRVLLVRHTYVAGWHLPGGGVETGETAQEALARELTEEAAISLSGPPTIHGILFNGHVSRRDHVVVFVVRAFSDGGPRRPDREIAEARFFPLAELPDGTTAGTRARLDEVVNGRPAPGHWSSPPG